LAQQRVSGGPPTAPVTNADRETMLYSDTEPLQPCPDRDDKKPGPACPVVLGFVKPPGLLAVEVIYLDQR
jgi:hypothetical protein